jgi:hypothetical protein
MQMQEKLKLTLVGEGTSPKVVSFTVQVVVDRHLVVPNTPSIGARTLVGWQEVGGFAQCHLVGLLFDADLTNLVGELVHVMPQAMILPLS